MGSSIANCSASNEKMSGKEKAIKTSMKRTRKIKYQSNVHSVDKCPIHPVHKMDSISNDSDDTHNNVESYDDKPTGIYGNKRNITEYSNDEKTHNPYNANHDHNDYKEEEIIIKNANPAELVEHDDNITNKELEILSRSSTPSTSIRTSITSRTELSVISVSQSQLSWSTQPPSVLTKKNSKSWTNSHFNEYETDLKKQIAHLSSQSLSNFVYHTSEKSVDIRKKTKIFERRHSLISFDNFREWSDHEMSQHKDEMLTQFECVRHEMKMSQDNNTNQEEITEYN